METKLLPSEDELQDVHTKTFRMQATGADGRTVRVSIPRYVVRREADKRGLELEQFLEEFRIEWLYDGFDGAYARFVPAEKETDESQESK